MSLASSRPSAFLQGLTCIAALAAIGVVLAVRSAPITGDTVNMSPAADVEVGHDFPLTLAITMSAGAGPGLADIQATSIAPVFVTVPAAWKLREARHALLRDIVGFASGALMRWKIPPGATVSFSLPETPSSLIIHNKSLVALLVVFKRIDVKSGKMQQGSVLIKDEPTALW